MAETPTHSMDKSGRRNPSIRWFAALFGLILLLGIGQPVLAIPPLPWTNQSHSGAAPRRGKNLSTQTPSGRLREVEPPGAVTVGPEARDSLGRVGKSSAAFCFLHG